MAIAAGGLLWLSTLDVASGYWRLAAGIVVIGFGMGNVMAPATDAIMGALPRENAGVGSAMNDTTRQVGGALGVAILGSLLASVFRGSMEAATAGLPPEIAERASDSIGAAVRVAGSLGGPQGAALLAAANDAFIDAMGATLLVAASIAFAGALVTLLVLPAREAGQVAAHDAPETLPVADAAVS
jgi:hypothetical protein